MNRDISDALIIGSIFVLVLVCAAVGFMGTGPAPLPPWMP